VGAGAAGQRATRLSRRRGRSPRTRPSRARDSRAQEDTTAAAGRAIRSSALLRRGKAGTEPGRPGDGDGDECPAWRRRDWCSQNREAVTSAGRWIDELELPPPPLTWSPDPGRANGIPQSRVETRARAGREMNYRPGVHPGCPALAAAAAPGRLVGDRSVAYMRHASTAGPRLRVRGHNAAGLRVPSLRRRGALAPILRPPPCLRLQRSACKRSGWALCSIVLQ
jgi:hypothetical protein